MTRPVLRPVQRVLDAKIVESWNSGHKNVLAVAATGFGKTVLFSHRIAEHAGVSCAIAHRHELISQMSLSLARNEVRHRIIGSDTLRRECAALHMFELDANYIDPHARTYAASVDTLVKIGEGETWPLTVTEWIGDEAHHFLPGNKWGKAVKMFPNARGLGVTATPCRSDGKGLDGIFHDLVEAPPLRKLIDMGLLTPYRLIVSANNLDLSHVDVTASGEYSPPMLKEAVANSTINGDIVGAYKKFADGMLGITFAVDIAAAISIAESFRNAGIKAEVVTGKTPVLQRARILRDFRNRQIQMLVNVDLFGEGFDLPALEVVIMARPTASFSLFCQMFGRVLRLMIDPSILAGWDSYDDTTRRYFISISMKPHGIVIDHVGNANRHGLPDAPQRWALEGRQTGPAMSISVCSGCSSSYDRFLKACPYCKRAKPAPTYGSVSDIKMVDGDMTEISADALAAMRGEIAKVDTNTPVLPWGVPQIAIDAFKKRHFNKQQQQALLRRSIQLWAGWQRKCNFSDGEIYRKFYLSFGVDIMTAQTLNERDAVELKIKIDLELLSENVVDANFINVT